MLMKRFPYLIFHNLQDFHECLGHLSKTPFLLIHAELVTLIFPFTTWGQPTAEVRAVFVKCSSWQARRRLQSTLLPRTKYTYGGTLGVLSTCSTRSHYNPPGLRIRRLTELIGLKSLLTADRNYLGGNNQLTKRHKGQQVDKESTPNHYTKLFLLQSSIQYFENGELEYAISFHLAKQGKMMEKIR